MIGRIITTDADVAEGAAWLAAREPRFAAALVETGDLPLRRRGDGFSELLSAIVGQQVSTASASAIWARIAAAGMDQQAAVRGATDADLQGCGLSRPKVRYARALADNALDYSRLRAMADEVVIAELCKIVGIGRWTAEVYALSSLGRADVFPSGDLALQEAAKLVFALEARPGEKAMAEMARAWSPWRAVAARLLWAYYRVAKNREGIR
jgi:DNA-3-methyladenine glycosylase II